jgi:hypothetical protein
LPMSSAPHLSRLNGGLATTTSNFIRRSFSRCLGSRIVSPHSMRASEGVAGFPEHAVDFGLVYEKGYVRSSCRCQRANGIHNESIHLQNQPLFQDGFDGTDQGST